MGMLVLLGLAGDQLSNAPQARMASHRMEVRCLEGCVAAVEIQGHLLVGIASSGVDAVKAGDISKV